MLNFRNVNKLTYSTTWFHWRQISKDMQWNNLSGLEDSCGWRILKNKLEILPEVLKSWCWLGLPPDCSQSSLDTNWTSEQPLGRNTTHGCWVVAFLTPIIILTHTTPHTTQIGCLSSQFLFYIFLYFYI